MEHKAWCTDCYFKREVSSPGSRWNHNQQAKEVFNILMKMGMNSHDFCYCIHLGELRSLVAELSCSYYNSNA